MEKKGEARERITLVCTECKEENYRTEKNKKNTPERLEIKRYCKEHRLKKIVWYSETVSGTKKPEKRQLGNLMTVVNKGDIVIVAELSRLGRSLIMILNILQTFLEKGVEVRAIKEGYELGDNIQSKVLAFAFGLSAESFGRKRYCLLCYQKKCR